MKYYLNIIGFIRFANTPGMLEVFYCGNIKLHNIVVREIFAVATRNYVKQKNFRKF